ncbi:MAG: hypothetical protein GY753_04725, partial [Gammaproteobacteria bacterium]|nr:hypothetical protein [Gammaproteobacteria bacterium]
TARGVILLDHKGRLLRILNESSGLRDEDILSTYVDMQGGLWLGLNNGLARIETDTSLSYFDKTLGLQGTVEQVAQHQGGRYATTSQGIYKLQASAAGAPARFESIPGVSRQCWSLLSTEEALLAGCDGGLVEVGAEHWLWEPEVGLHVFTLHRSRRDPTRLYLGLSNGLVRMRLIAGQWTDAVYIGGVQEQVRTIVEVAQGQLWLGTQSSGVLRLDPTDDPDEPIITRFGPADGLPPGWLGVTTLAGQVAILSEQGTGLFRRMHTESGSPQDNHGQISDLRFESDTTFNTLLAQGSGHIKRLTEDQQGRVWIAADEASGVAFQSADGSYTFAPTALRRVPHLAPYNIVPEADGQVWITSRDALIRLDGNRTLDPSTDYPVWIRRITSTGNSLLYDGQSSEVKPWPYQNNALRFAFAAPRYNAPERTHYRTRLDGFEEDWSAWSIETDKDYTNLWEGEYIFYVQARDVYGFISREDAFS